MAKKEYLTARIPSTLKSKIEKIAKEERRSVSQVAEMLLEDGLKARNEKES